MANSSTIDDAVSEKSSELKTYKIRTNGSKDSPNGRPSMPLTRIQDSPTYREWKKKEQDGFFHTDPVTSRKFPQGVIPSLDAFLVLRPDIEKQIREECYKAAKEAGRVANKRGEFTITTTEDDIFEILQTLVPLDETLGLNFPYGSEIFLDQEDGVFISKARCMQLRQRYKAQKAAKEGRDTSEAVNHLEEWSKSAP
jgi:hypothetical protein